jgi:hypothetical protein
MSSLRDGIASSVVPFTPSISVKAVANLVGLVTSPVSIRQLMDFVSPVPAFQSGPLTALTVHGSSAVAFHPSGVYAFVGKAHDSSCYVGVCVSNPLFNCSAGIDISPRTIRWHCLGLRTARICR